MNVGKSKESFNTNIRIFCSYVKLVQYGIRYLQTFDAQQKVKCVLICGGYDDIYATGRRQVRLALSRCTPADGLVNTQCPL